MIRSALVAAFLSITSPVLAWDLPAAFDVTGVAADDVLNVRAAPAADSPVLSTIPPDAKGVEVVAESPDGKWGMVSTGEGNGWVALRFLLPQPILDPDALPRPMTCLGTEPFWLLAHERGHDRIAMPGQEDELLSVGLEMAAPQGYFVLSQGRQEDDKDKPLYQLTITRQICGDGMSDRQFGFDARLFISDPRGNRLLHGCCTLDQR